MTFCRCERRNLVLAEKVLRSCKLGILLLIYWNKRKKSCFCCFRIAKSQYVKVNKLGLLSWVHLSKQKAMFVFCASNNCLVNIFCGCFLFIFFYAKNIYDGYKTISKQTFKANFFPIRISKEMKRKKEMTFP